MKIGLIRRGFSRTGGAEAFLQRFADGARAAGHPCVLFADEKWPQWAWDQERVTVAGKSPRAFADAVEAARPREHCDFLFSFERVWKCDAYRAGDGVHAAWLERRAQIEPAWKGYLRRYNLKHRALLELERALFAENGAGQVVANSHLVKGEIIQRFSYPAERIHVVHNGLPRHLPQDSARSVLREAYQLKDDRYVLLFGGTGWERKGLRCAIEAVEAATSDAFLLIAGRGDPRNMPPSKRIHYIGQTVGLGPVLAACDAFILPTIYDPFSNACLEAIAAGRPVITTAANGFSEVLEPDEGDVVAHGTDVAALARAIDRWSDPGKRADLYPRLIEKGIRLSIEENVRATLAIIEKAAQPAPPA